MRDDISQAARRRRARPQYRAEGRHAAFGAGAGDEPAIIRAGVLGRRR